MGGSRLRLDGHHVGEVQPRSGLATQKQYEVYIYIYMVPPPKIDHFMCFISGDTSQNLQGLGLLASQLHLASAFWLHRMSMLKKPEEIKQIKKIRVLGENAQVRISESE